MVLFIKFWIVFNILYLNLVLYLSIYVKLDRVVFSFFLLFFFMYLEII